MKKILLFLIFSIPLISYSQNLHIFDDEFKKLEIYEGKFQHSFGQVFRSELSADNYGCWMKPVFKRIIFDTANSRLSLEGKIVCENQGNKKMDEDDFIFILGNIKIDTVKSGDKVITSLTVFQNDIFTFKDANEFKFTLKITDVNNVLCFTTLKNSEEKSGNKKTYYPVDPAHFYEIGKLISR